MDGHDTKKLMKQIHEIIIKTVISIQPKLLHTYNVLQPRSKEHDMCFEILGFDIFIDEEAKPWLIEVNHMPSFNQDTKVDKDCKQKLIRDTLTLLNLNPDDKKRKCDFFKKELTLRRTNEKTTRESIESMIVNGLKFKKKREKYENCNLGHFLKIYPNNDIKYKICYQTALDEWKNQNGYFTSTRFVDEEPENTIGTKELIGIYYKIPFLFPLKIHVCPNFSHKKKTIKTVI